MEFPVYKVVIDAGHGGYNMKPTDQYGDRYDPITKKFLRGFNYGASLDGYDENILMYQISGKVMAILKLLDHKGDFDKFKMIAAKYSNSSLSRVIIESHEIRPKGKNRIDVYNSNDPNKDFRIFDGNGLGRISKINSLKPHLVVSLHCDQYMPGDNRGFGAVIAPPHSFLLKAKDNLARNSSTEYFDKSPYSGWIREDFRRSLFQWYLSDSMYYLMGYPLTAKNELNYDRFSSYSYNMVSWRYADKPGWEISASKHPHNSQYSDNIDTLALNSPYWQRERSVYESYRRENGNDGFGGDNYFSAMEIIRFALTSLFLNNADAPVQKTASPYISIWAIPLYINAISAYMELGCLGNERLRYLLIYKQDEIAEGIAVGIYSLFAGIDIKADNYTYKPMGKKLDIEKYSFPDGNNYFDSVIE